MTEASDDFYAQVNNLRSFLMLSFVRWGAINLLDFYVVRRGDYDVRAFFDPRGEYYHDPASWTWSGVNIPAMVAYVVGIAAALLFVYNGWYAGAAAEALGGADLSWAPGLVVTGLVYLALVRVARSRTSRPAAATAPPAAATGTSRPTAGVAGTDRP